MHRRIDVLTDNLPEVTEAKGWFRPETRRVAPITLDVMWDHFLSRHWAQLSPELPLPEFVRYAHTQVTLFCPILRRVLSISTNTCGQSAGLSAIGIWILFSAC
jgi:acyl carrier protein phosphodiesterase